MSTIYFLLLLLHVTGQYSDQKDQAASFSFSIDGFQLSSLSHFAQHHTFVPNCVSVKSLFPCQGVRALEWQR